jgi:hypothetical protein
MDHLPRQLLRGDLAAQAIQTALVPVQNEVHPDVALHCSAEVCVSGEGVTSICSMPSTG